MSKPMNQTDRTARLVERILAGMPRAVVLLGPAAGGKTSVVLTLQEQTPNGGCLLIAPNAPAVAQLRRRLLQRTAQGVIVSPKVMTFAAVARQVLGAARPDVRTLTPFRRRLLLREIVDDLAGKGKLATLAGVADTPGLIVSLDRSIAELKRAAVDPDTLAKAIARPKGKHAELLAVYRQYQRRLHAEQTYDLQGRMWLLRDMLSEGPEKTIAPLDGIGLIAADGFTDFTPTQLEILHLLGRRGIGVVITLPSPTARDEPPRERMWHWTQRTLNNIRSSFGGKLDEIELDPAGDGVSAAAVRRVFAMDAGPVEPPPDALYIVAAAGQDAEIGAAAVSIKQLLADGAAAGSIAVIARALDTYRPAIERIFADCDIPVSPASQPLTDVPIIRFALDTASIGPEFLFPQVLRVIKSSYFRPQSLGDFDELTSLAAEMLIREGNVLGGRDAYAKAAAFLANRTGDDDRDGEIALGPLSLPAEAIRSAAAMLEAMFAASESATDAAGLERLVGTLQLAAAAHDHDDESLIARDLRALAMLRQAIAELAGRDQTTTVAHLREALQAVMCPAPCGESFVDVLDVLDARALRYDHVFLLGVNESAFPLHMRSGAMVSEADRLAWASRAVVLDGRDDLTAREMLLFYLAASRADRSLTVSYLLSDEGGSPDAPSGFLLSLAEPFGGLEAFKSAGAMTIIPAGGFATAERTVSRRDAVNAAVAGLFEAGFGDTAGLLRWAAQNDEAGIRRAAAGIIAHSRRWSTNECDRFDGRITDAKLKAHLSEQFGPAHVFSPSQLNSFGQCPWQFFAAYVLGLRPLATPQRHLEAVAKGIFCHNVLYRLFTTLRDECGGPVRLGDFDPSPLRDVLAEAVSAEAAAVRPQLPLYPSLWDIQQQQMHREIEDYILRRQINPEQPFEGLHFELSFAAEHFAPQMRDPASRSEPVVITTPSGAIRLRGKIDRVDRIELEGGRALRVVDYKTGGLPERKDIKEGRNLQLPLYTLAAEQILGGPCAGGEFHRIGEDETRRFPAADTPEAVELVGRLVAQMREGRFDLLPTDKCPSYCPYRQICQYSPVRAARMQPAETEGEQ